MTRLRLAALLLASVPAAVACDGEGVRPNTTVAAADTADQRLDGFSHHVMSPEGIRRSRVDADTAYLFEASQTSLLVGVRVVFFGKQGEETSTLTARRMEYAWQDGSMRAEGDVVLTSPDGRRLTTSSLRYDVTANTISTDKHFVLIRGGEHLEGDGFTGDPDFKNVVATRPRGVAGDSVLLPGQ